MAETTSIAKNPILPPGMDYGLLRRLAMAYIEAMGSALWTDYNIHDPGITIMEALCYAITDLGYRANMPIADLLAVAPSQAPHPERQGFYTARNILTAAPLTIQDYRKLLIDIDGIRNGWLQPRQCACGDLYLYANCKTSALQYEATEHRVVIGGMYDVLVEFEDTDSSGDLNSGRLRCNFAFPAGTGLTQPYAHATLELRLPPWHQLEANPSKYEAFRKPGSKLRSVKVKFISGNKGDDQNILQQDLGAALRRVLFATLEVSYYPDPKQPAFVQQLLLPDVPLLVWFHSDADRKALQLPDLALALEDGSSAGILARYLARIHEADRVMALTRQALHANRNLCEDYCGITSVKVQDVAVCADIELEPGADIEAVLAEAYFLISSYMSPGIRFWSLAQLLETGKPTEDIFNGPALRNGFIDDEQLAATGLKDSLRSSDVLNLLMDIPGVISVRNFVFSPFDAEGRRLPPESWTYDVPAGHQPRLYMEASKFLVYKNGLSFLPDQLELTDTLRVIQGQHAQPRFPLGSNDLPVTPGTFQALDAYQSIQYELPLTYGVGPYGLPAEASGTRRAEARQLKAFLLFFDQILVAYLAQLRNIGELFAIDDSVRRSYFMKLLRETDIRGLDAIYTAPQLDETQLGELAESRPAFLDRRNRFLDMMLARFAEQFTDYTLMLYAYTGNKARADEVLIEDKVAFLRDLPVMSRERGISFNYRRPGGACRPDNRSGLELRIARLLGMKGLGDFWELYEEHDTDGISYERRWRLRDDKGKILLSSSTRYYDPDFDVATGKAKEEIAEVLRYIAVPERYEIRKSRKWVLNLTDPTGEVIATRKQHFSKKTDAEAARDYLIGFAKSLLLREKIFVVEHLLLRPVNRPGAPGIPLGDPLLQICIGPDCGSLCMKEDPYSFRMTIVMSGDKGFANEEMPFRDFAERTIRKEIPAHLGLKICWVSPEQLVEFETRWCAYLKELSAPSPDLYQRHLRLRELLQVFNNLKSVYPPASLHDCADGNDENRVYLNKTIV